MQQRLADALPEMVSVMIRLDWTAKPADFTSSELSKFLYRVESAGDNFRCRFGTDFGNVSSQEITQESPHFP